MAQHYEGDVADLGLFFVIEDTHFGQVSSTELLPGGRDKGVDRDNAIHYVWLVANYRLNSQVRP